jgi:hypothetical protein
MQETYIDRIILKADFNYCQLIIPSKKDFAASFFSGLFVLIFGAGIIVSLVNLIFHHSNDANFYSIWTIGASVPWVFLLRVFLWNTIGKEVITIENGLVTINRPWLFFSKQKKYELQSVRNLRTDFDYDSYEERKWHNQLGIGMGRLKLAIKLSGTFLFDYNGETIKFGDSLDKDDADLVLQKLKEIKIVSPSNLSQ